MKHRYVALDWMRGIAMVLMAIDHASGTFNKNRLLTDSIFLYKAGTDLPTLDFFTRWITHICAPTFLFLAGTAIALSLERRMKAGEPGASIDRYLLTRGLIIALLDPLFISWFWGWGSIMLQVLYAIGISFVLMILLRRVRTSWLLGGCLAFFLICELLTGIIFKLGDKQPIAAVIGGSLIHGGAFPGLTIAYPVLPWTAMMVLGFVFGKKLLQIKDSQTPVWSPEKVILIGGIASLFIFTTIRGINSYGNMLLLRENNTVIQWLHVSKYPPSLSFTALELGLMGIILSLLFIVQVKARKPIRSWNPILVFGQTALFFYILHIAFLEISARLLHLHVKMGLGTTYIATVAVLLVLYPCCLWYRQYKASHPSGWPRYL